jgi:2-dehydro-3-deoxygluconokinase
MPTGGLDLSHVIWRPFDGIGRDCRVGLNFTEKGYGLRSAVGCSDRAHSAASQMKPGDTSMATLNEVETAMRGKGARVIR